MKTRGDDIEEFATFARLVQSCRKNVYTYQQMLEYNKSLFEASLNSVASEKHQLNFVIILHRPYMLLIDQIVVFLFSSLQINRITGYIQLKVE